jgi:hypothetical protein
MELEVFFTIIQQTYSKLVISFMNRKSSCEYATHFFFLSLCFSYTYYLNISINFFLANTLKDSTSSVGVCSLEWSMDVSNINENPSRKKLNKSVNYYLKKKQRKNVKNLHFLIIVFLFFIS